MLKEKIEYVKSQIGIKWAGIFQSFRIFKHMHSGVSALLRFLPAQRNRQARGIIRDMTDFNVFCCFSCLLLLLLSDKF